MGHASRFLDWKRQYDLMRHFDFSFSLDVGMRHKTRPPSLHSTNISSDVKCSIFLYQSRVGLPQIRVLLVLVSSLIPCQFVCDITDSFGVAQCTCDLTQVVPYDSHMVVELVSSTDREHSLMIAVLQHRVDQRSGRARGGRVPQIQGQVVEVVLVILQD